MNDHSEFIKTINDIVGQISFTRLRITFEALQNIQLYEYNGSAYRGCLSDTLKQLFCTTSQPTCQQCQRRFNCPHAVIIHSFTPPSDSFASKYPLSPNPFLIVPEFDTPLVIVKGASFGFDFIFIGDKVSYLQPLIEAFHQMGMIGIGRQRGKFRLISVQCMLPDFSFKPLSDNQKPSIITLQNLPKQILTRNLTLVFETNLRLMVALTISEKKKRTLLEKAPEFSLLMSRLLDRMINVAYFHCGTPYLSIGNDLHESWNEVKVENETLTFYRWIRHSGTQNKNLLFDGLRGSITYVGDFSAWLPILTLGQWLHVGSSTSFGLGKYTIQQDERTPL